MASEAEIERIVQAVIARLGAPSVPSKPARHTLRSSPLGQSPRNGCPNGQLVLREQVVSLSQLEDQLNGVSCVVVRERAVITPAASDLLRQRGVQIERYTGDAQSAGRQSVGLALAVAETKYCPAGLVRELNNRSIEVEQLPRTGLAEGIAELADRVRLGGMHGLVLTERPQAAVCLANRHRGVRAAWTIDGASVGGAIAEVAANVIIVDPARSTGFTLRQMLKVFCDGQDRPCPAVYRNWLE